MSKGFLIAWDPIAGREAWRIEHNGPWNGGTLATAGGLVFQGTIDGRFLAIDARSGKPLWSFDNHISTLAGPMTYAVNGEQYVAVLSGRGSVYLVAAGGLAPSDPVGVQGRVQVYKLGGTATALPVASSPTEVAAPPVMKVSARDVERGAGLYGQYCFICHGVGAMGGVIADLRRSPRLQTAEAWKTVVIGGTMTSRGMPKFDEYLKDADAELIRAYVARQAALASNGARQ
jgi:quinohemoprotein ethanol dehydrogenase